MEIELEKLRPVQYSKKQNLISQDYNKEEFGFIAQEVRKLLPSLVSEGLDEDKLLSMDYNSLISILTKAIQEQQLQMDSYKAENEELKNRISKIEKALRIE
ncbi:MAG: tail fiber domain-containing protein [Flavobacteriales bacterium]